ncbi:MAG TPA: hypothetical protein VJV75_08535 [Candidatus Polarisedimenticolia bacterium]|nr:hypothetical protein [Candidatus Polarisedimenticolia bacterium]
MLRPPIFFGAFGAGLLLVAWLTNPGRMPGTVGPGAETRHATGGVGLEFPTSDPVAWINSKPLTLAGLRGQVVLIDVFTYG